ncbi:MAG: VanZ family protein [Ruminococcus sp.]|nr:VanZ family protein [Ruminococcus sp.]
MKIEKGNYLFRIIMILITAGLIAFAFIHSSMTADDSGAESAATMGVLQSILNSLGIDFELTDHIVRKIAHFTEYTAIGIMLMNTAYSFNKSRPYLFFPHILFAGLFTAVIDEAIQLNVPGRAGLITDVLLDFLGVITGIIVMFVILIIYKVIRKKRR